MNQKLETALLAPATPVIALNSSVVEHALASGGDSLDRSYALLVDEFDCFMNDMVAQYRSLDARSEDVGLKADELAQAVVDAADRVGAARISQLASAIQRTFQANSFEFASHELSTLVTDMEAALDLFLTYASPYGVSRRAA
ncbi:MAG: hypothetical protein AAGC91_13255 [Pseudomonadota bacterium]